MELAQATRLIDQAIPLLQDEPALVRALTRFRGQQPLVTNHWPLATRGTAQGRSGFGNIFEMPSPGRSLRLQGATRSPSFCNNWGTFCSWSSDNLTPARTSLDTSDRIATMVEVMTGLANPASLARGTTDRMAPDDPATPSSAAERAGLASSSVASTKQKRNSRSAGPLALASTLG